MTNKKKDELEIDEAIKLLQKDIAHPGSVDIMDVNRAEELGIVALNFLKEWRGKEKKEETKE